MPFIRDIADTLRKNSIAINADVICIKNDLRYSFFTHIFKMGFAGINAKQKSSKQPSNNDIFTYTFI